MTSFRLASCLLALSVLSFSQSALAQPTEPAEKSDAAASDAPATAPTQPAESQTTPVAAPLPTPPSEGPTEPESKPAPEAETKKEASKGSRFKIRSEDGDHELTLTGRVQAHFGGTSTKAGDRTNNGAFSIRRARLGLEGRFGDHLSAKTQTEFGQGFLHLKDFFVDVKVASAVWIRFGQWKRPFSRQQINSSGRLELVDRAITNGAFEAGRDVGVALRNDYEKSVPIEWTLGVFNGGSDRPAVTGSVVVDDETGQGTITGGGLSNVPKNWKPTIVGRVGINHGKLAGYSEADLEGGGLRFGIASSLLLEADGDRNGAASHKAELDFIVKAHGFSSSGAVYLASQGAGFAKDQAASLLGAHIQAGYTADRTHGAVARYAMVTGIADNETKAVHELLVGYNFFSTRGHQGKLQVDMGARKNGSAKISDDLRLQLQAEVGF